MSLVSGLFATKSVAQLQKQAEASTLKRTLGKFDLLSIGVGDIIGGGIFVITGHVAAVYAGPAVVLSFAISAVACAFAGLCYAELAAMIPVSGSAYTYAYAAGGELLAWIVGWDLMLEYLVGSALVAQGWSAYFLKFLDKAFSVVPAKSWTDTPLAWTEKDGFASNPGAVINLPALVITLIVTVVLTMGISASARFNHFFVIIKLAVVLLFLFATVSYIKPANWSPFIPEPTAEHAYGWGGVFKASFSVFFSYIGFDAVSTTAGEAVNPQRDMPFGILGSLGLCTVLYMLVAFVLTGIAPYTELGGAAPLATAVSNLGLGWVSVLVSLGALAGLTSVLTVALMSQPRVFFSMANDGLLPPIFAKLHPKFKSPFVPILLNGVLVGLSSAFIPLDILNDMTSSGTLFAFALVCVSVGILRVTQPDAERPFRVPGGAFLVPALGVLTCAFLLISGGLVSILRLFVWMAIGLVVYFSYGIRHSKLRIENASSSADGSSSDSTVYGSTDTDKPKVVATA
ncbi:amino acid/polyamine transporter I [Blastocladiella britannica]|nr:amino acid/polyamine transporter I [Blastocladiella britannica]